MHYQVAVHRNEKRIYQSIHFFSQRPMVFIGVLDAVMNAAHKRHRKYALSRAHQHRHRLATVSLTVTGLRIGFRPLEELFDPRHFLTTFGNLEPISHKYNAAIAKSQGKAGTNHLGTQSGQSVQFKSGAIKQVQSR
jgi:hypothetical protein